MTSPGVAPVLAGERASAAPAARAPKYSVVIPAYNAADILPECLLALKQQTCAADQIEIIVVDDGSSDATVEVAACHGAIVVSQPHSNQAAARNNGAARAHGILVLFTDADCVPDSDWVRRMAEPFTDPTVAGVTGRYRTRQRGLLPRFVQEEFEDRYERLEPQASIDFVDSYAAAYRLDVFRELGGFDSSFPIVEDIELSFRCQRAGYRLVFAPAAVVYHRHRERLQDYIRTKRRAASWWVEVYGRHPGKIGNDSRQPRQILIQIALGGLICALAPFALVSGLARGALLACLAAFSATTFPVVRRASRSDRALAATVPLFSLVRAISQFVGIVLALGRRVGVPSS